MIPFPNAIAGILIGVVNTNWLARIIVPFIWGLVFCIYVWIFEGERRAAFINEKESGDQKAKWGMSNLMSFYFIEYTTASVTSLFFSIIAGLLRSLFLLWQ